MIQQPVVIHISVGTLIGLAVGSAFLAACSTFTLITLRSTPISATQSKEEKKERRSSAKTQDSHANGYAVVQAHLPSPTLDLGAWTESKRRDHHDPSPRRGYLEWDDYFMALAFLSAQRSKDPNKQVGAVIVGMNRVVLGIGYNGFPRGCPDHALPWAKKPPPGTTNPLDTKYPYVVHAEANALLNTNTALIQGSTLYVTMFPCNECAKLLIQAGIKSVCYHEEKVGSDTCEDISPTQSRAITPSVCVDGACTAEPCRHYPSTAVSLSEDGSKQSVAGVEACYLASKKLLTMAGITLRQHKLTRTVVLKGPP